MQKHIEYRYLQLTPSSSPYLPNGDSLLFWDSLIGTFPQIVPFFPSAFHHLYYVNATSNANFISAESYKTDKISFKIIQLSAKIIDAHLTNTIHNDLSRNFIWLWETCVNKPIL